MKQVKSALASRTVWAGVVTILASLAGLLGYRIGPDLQAEIVTLVSQGIAVLAGIATIWGRIVATRRIA